MKYVKARSASYALGFLETAAHQAAYSAQRFLVFSKKMQDSDRIDRGVWNEQRCWGIIYAEPAMRYTRTRDACDYLAERILDCLPQEPARLGIARANRELRYPFRIAPG